MESCIGLWGKSAWKVPKERLKPENSDVIGSCVVTVEIIVDIIKSLSTFILVVIKYMAVTTWSLSSDKYNCYVCKIQLEKIKQKNIS